MSGVRSINGSIMVVLMQKAEEAYFLPCFHLKKKNEEAIIPLKSCTLFTTLTLTLLWKRYSLINSCIETTIPTTNFMESWNSSISDALHTQVKYRLGPQLAQTPIPVHVGPRINHPYCWSDGSIPAQENL